MKPKNTLTPTKCLCQDCMYYFYTELITGKDSIATNAKDVTNPCNGVCKYNPDPIAKNFDDCCGRFLEYK